MKQITDAELKLMDILWDSPRSMTSREIHEGLLKKAPETEWKITTVLTLLGRLADKGFVGAERTGRARSYWYSPCVQRDEYAAKTAKGLLRAVGGSYKHLVMNLIAEAESGGLSEADLEELRAFIDQKRNGGHAR